MNIYDGCIDNTDVFYRTYDTSWDEQLDKKKQYYEDQGYKVVFTFAANSFQDAARAVLYNKDAPIPLCMQDYKHKYVRLNGHWVIESQLGVCDKCGQYKVLVSLSTDGRLCEECDEGDF